MMIHTDPMVSIGLPVYNGERYISEEIESLLNQTFHDFEIIICDNASTDGTEAICRSYGSSDTRIRYYRNSQNIGAAANFNRTFGLASGKYFKWAAHDDLHAPDFLLRCVEVLDKDPSVVLCHSEVQFIDESGRYIKNPDRFLPDASSPEAHVRFSELIRMVHWCLDIFGLMRSDALKRTPLISNYVGSDRNTLVILALLGRFHRVPECLFFNREHAERSVRKTRPAFRAAWFDPKNRNRISLPRWRILFEYIKSLSAVELPVKQRMACWQHLFRWPGGHSRLLKKDLRLASKSVITRLYKV